MMEGLRDHLFCLSTVLESKRRAVENSLRVLQEAMAAKTGGNVDSTDWVEGELTKIKGQIQDAEKAEPETWVLAVWVGGESSRNARAQNWTEWLQKTLVTIHGPI